MDLAPFTLDLAGVRLSGATRGPSPQAVFLHGFGGATVSVLRRGVIDIVGQPVASTPDAGANREQAADQYDSSPRAGVCRPNPA